MASEEDIVIKFEGEDVSATEVAKKVREQIDKEFKEIGFAGEDAARSFEDMSAELQSIDWGGIEDGSERMGSLADAAASAAGQVGLLSSDIGNLIEVLGTIPSAPVAIIGGIVAGAAVAGKAAIEDYQATLDKIFKGNGQDIYTSTAQAVEGQMFLDRQRQAREQAVLDKRSKQYWQGQDEEFRRQSVGNSFNKYLDEQRVGIAELDDPLAKAASDARRRLQQDMEKNQAWIPKQEQEAFVAAAVEVAKAEQARSAELEKQKELKEEMARYDEEAQKRVKGWIEKSMSEKELRNRDELKLLEDMTAGRISKSMFDQAMIGIAKQYADDPEKAKKVKLDFGGDNVYASRFATRGLGRETTTNDLLKKIAELLKSNDANQQQAAKGLIDWLNLNGVAVGAAN